MAQDDMTARLDRMDKIARTMDTAFRIPGTGIRVGWDSIIGLIPGVGDAAALAPAAWIVMECHRMGAPRHILVRQGINVAIDAVAGSVPLLGDLLDVGFKANRRNVALMREHLAQREIKQTEPVRPVEGEGHLSSHHPDLGGAGGQVGDRPAGPREAYPTSSIPAKK